MVPVLEVFDLSAASRLRHRGFLCRGARVWIFGRITRYSEKAMAKGFSGADAGGPFRRKPPLPLAATASPRMGGRMVR
jgi:hypothetical protein